MPDKDAQSNWRGWIGLALQLLTIVGGFVWFAAQVDATTKRLAFQVEATADKFTDSVDNLTVSVNELRGTILRVQETQNQIRERLARIEGRDH